MGLRTVFWIFLTSKRVMFEKDICADFVWYPVFSDLENSWQTSVHGQSIFLKYMYMYIWRIKNQWSGNVLKYSCSFLKFLVLTAVVKSMYSVLIVNCLSFFKHNYMNTCTLFFCTIWINFSLGAKFSKTSFIDFPRRKSK